MFGYSFFKMLSAGKVHTDDHVFTHSMWYHVICLEESGFWTGWSLNLKSSPDQFQCTLRSLVVHRWPLRGTAAHQIIAPVYFRLCILTVHQPTHQANIQILLHYYEHRSPNSLCLSLSLSLSEFLFLSLSALRWGTLKTMLIKIGD